MSSVTSTTGLIARCPLECNVGFDTSDVLLPEGPLPRCRSCGQLLSQVSAERFRRSMAEFDDPRGTAPDAQAIDRWRTLARQRLENIRALLSKRVNEIELLDVGCSSGAFALTARELGYRAHGVEPAPAAAESARPGFERVYQHLAGSAVPAEPIRCHHAFRGDRACRGTVTATA